MDSSLLVKVACHCRPVPGCAIRLPHAERAAASTSDCRLSENLICLPDERGETERLLGWREGEKKTEEEGEKNKKGGLTYWMLDGHISLQK